MPIYVNNVAMTEPGNAPYVPNLLKNLFLNFNAAIDAPGDGGRVASVVMRGNAPLADRTFSLVRGTGTTKPVSVGGADPYLDFDGNSTLANANASAGMTRVSGQFTAAFHLSIGDWSKADANIGFLRGIFGRTAAIRPGGSEGVIEVAGGVSGASWASVTTDIKTDEKAVIIVVWDDTNGDKILAGNGGVKNIGIASGASMQGIGFGRNAEATTGAAVFKDRCFAVWDRALSNDELLMVREIWLSGEDIQS
ncbi:hypothetical protein [Klebsiella quasipneumoniae]|uniref:hypothetical protein n=1 Tax=Klebsiella quasipneumoniae TaxID=1463165 RepID=UPI00403B0D22